VDRNFILAMVLSMLVVTLWSSTRPLPEPAERQSPSVAGETETNAAPQRPRAPERAAAPAGGERPTFAAPVAFEPAITTIAGERFRARMSTRGGTLIEYALLDDKTTEVSGPKR